MDYTKELAEQLVALDFELVPSMTISEIELPADLADVYVKTTPNGRVVVLPADENMIGTPSKLYFLSESGVETKFTTKDTLGEDIAIVCGYSMGTTDAVALESEDDKKNEEAEDEGKSIVERYASLDTTPIMERVKLYSKLHPEDDYTEILTLLEDAKNLPRVEEIQKEHELQFPRMLIMEGQVSEETRNALERIYNPPPTESPKVEVEDHSEEIQKLESELNEEKSKNQELVDVIDKLGERIHALTEKLGDIMRTLNSNNENPQALSDKRAVQEPKRSTMAGYGNMLTTLASVPFEGEVYGK